MIQKDFGGLVKAWEAAYEESGYIRFWNSESSREQMESIFAHLNDELNDSIDDFEWQVYDFNF